MRNIEHIVEDLNRYFYSIFKNREVSSAETFQAIHHLLEYYFAANDMDLACYNITIHKDKTLGKDCTQAYMYPDCKYDDKYDVYLNPKSMKMKNESYLERIVFVFLNAAHEFQHIVQFETMPALANHSYNTLCDLTSKLDQYSHTSDKKLLRLFNRYYDVFSILGDVEKDADKKAFENLENMFADISFFAESEDYFNFLGLCFEILEGYKAQRKQDWKDYNKKFKKVSQEMKKYYDLETPLG